MPGKLHIETYLPTGVVPPLYAVVFAQNGQAFKLVTGHWSLAAFLKVNQPDYAMPLTGNAERTLFNSIDILEADIDLLYNAVGEMYTVEIWSQVGDDPDRDADVMVYSYNFSWVQVEASAWICHAQPGYDSSNHKFSLYAWLEKDGELYQTPASIAVVFRNSSDDIVFTAPADPLDPQENGKYYISQEDLVLSPDEIYTALITIEDADGGFHTSLTAISTWD